MRYKGTEVDSESHGEIEGAAKGKRESDIERDLEASGDKTLQK